MSLNAKFMVDRRDAVEHGETYGTRIGVAIVAFIVLIVVTGYCPMGLKTAILVSTVALLAARYGTGFWMGHSWDGYAAKRQELQRNGMEYQAAYDAVANM